MPHIVWTLIFGALATYGLAILVRNRAFAARARRKDNRLREAFGYNRALRSFGVTPRGWGATTSRIFVVIWALGWTAIMTDAFVKSLG
jgi:hypothetical protein